MSLPNECMVLLVFKDGRDTILDSQVIGFSQIGSGEGVYGPLDKFSRFDNLIANKELYLTVRTHNCSVPGIGSGRTFVMQHTGRNLVKGATPFLRVTDFEHLLRNICRHARMRENDEDPRNFLNREIFWSNMYYGYLLKDSGDLIFLDPAPIEADGLRSNERRPNNSMGLDYSDDSSTNKSTSSSSSFAYESDGIPEIDLGFDDISLAPDFKLRASDSLLNLHVMDPSSLVDITANLGGDSDHEELKDKKDDTRKKSDLSHEQRKSYGSISERSSSDAEPERIAPAPVPKAPAVLLDDKSAKASCDVNHGNPSNKKDGPRKESALSQRKDYGSISDRSSSDNEANRSVPSTLVPDTTVTSPVQRAAGMTILPDAAEHDSEVASMIAKVKKDYFIQLPMTEKEALFIGDTTNHHVGSGSNRSINPEFLLEYHRLSGFSVPSICRQYFIQYHNNGIETNMVDTEIIDGFMMLGLDVQKAVLSVILVNDPLPFPPGECPYCLLDMVHEPVMCPLVISVSARDVLIKKQRKCAGCHSEGCRLQRSDHSSKGISCKKCWSTFHAVNACNSDVVWREIMSYTRRARFVIAVTRNLTTLQLKRLRDFLPAAREAYLRARNRRS